MPNPVAWWAWIVALVLFVASRPIEVRLWRAGRLSDRAVSILLLSRIPLVSLTVLVAQGAPLSLGLLVMGVSVLPMLLGYGRVLRLVREQHRAWSTSRDNGVH